MSANSNDVFMEVGSPGTATTLSSPGYTSGVSTAVTVGSTSNWPTATGIIFAIDEATVVNGVEVRVDGTYNEFEGTVASATSITSVDYVGGDAERSFSAGALTRVYIPVSAERENRMAQGMRAEHSQLDGTHTNVTATSVTTSGAVLTTPKVITSLNDTNNNELFKVTATSSAVNEFTVANAATGNSPQVSATGGDTNIDYKIATKGSGLLKVNGNPFMDGAWPSWTPAWANLTPGNGVITANYTQIGKTVHGSIKLVFGTTTSITGTGPTFTLPVTAASRYNSANNQIAFGYAEDSGVASYNVVLFLDSSTTVVTVRTASASGTYVANASALSSTTPFTWGTGDYFSATFTYESA